VLRLISGSPGSLMFTSKPIFAAVPLVSWWQQPSQLVKARALVFNQLRHVKQHSGSIEVDTIRTSDGPVHVRQAHAVRDVERARRRDCGILLNFCHCQFTKLPHMFRATLTQALIFSLIIE
jgi:hypothetical protein